MDREFLQLAKWWLICRYRVLGNQVSDAPHDPAEWPYALLGMIDHQNEMKAMLDQFKHDHKPRA